VATLKIVPDPPSPRVRPKDPDPMMDHIFDTEVESHCRSKEGIEACDETDDNGEVEESANALGSDSDDDSISKAETFRIEIQVRRIGVIS
jgi:hypothetical protein